MQVPARFDYEVATSVEDAIDLLERHGPEARLLAGGHSLIPMMKLRLAFPETLIDIHELDGDLRYIREGDGALEIGALARHQDVLDSEVVGERYPILRDAETMIADSLVRREVQPVRSPQATTPVRGHHAAWPGGERRQCLVAGPGRRRAGPGL